MQFLTYFAHPISLYHDAAGVERVIVEVLTEQHGFKLVNPSNERYQEAYRLRREQQPEENPMAYWLELAATCNNCVFLPFPRLPSEKRARTSYQAPISAGVVKEIGSFRERKRLVYWVDPNIKTPDDVHLRIFTGWSGFKRLTPEETRILLCAHGCITYSR